MERFLQYLNGPVTQERLLSLRVKALTRCGWACKWCHQEGNFNARALTYDDEFIRVLRHFRDEFGFTEVHFTGGEPTLHPDLASMVRVVNDSGMTSKLTTNGQSKIHVYKALVNAGLQEVNISIHTLNPQQLASLMQPVRSAVWAKQAIALQLTMIAELRPLIEVKVNTVVSQDTEDTLKIWLYCSDHGIPWRVMNAIGEGRESYNSLDRLLQASGGRITGATKISGSSSYRLSVIDRQGKEFRLKLLRPFYLKSMCSHCTLRSGNRCEEYAYGIRLELSQFGNLQVRCCLHQDGRPYVLPVNEFFQNSIAGEYREIFK